ncbi:hypothetical protein NMY22_g18838 [Coprinellus aureogranulatus]|nr:hypothetical protein NMY22_g18838 [Coprinellus aureogranulatus]
MQPPASSCAQFRPHQLHHDLFTAISSRQLRWTAEDDNVIHWAAAQKKANVLLALLKSYPLQANRYSPGGTTHNHEARRRNAIQSVLLGEFTSFDVPSTAYAYTGTPLMALCMTSARHHQEEIVGILNLLAQAGWNLHSRDMFGLTPFMLVAVYCSDGYGFYERDLGSHRCPILDYLCSIDPTIIYDRDPRGRTALMLVARVGKVHTASGRKESDTIAIGTHPHPSTPFPQVHYKVVLWLCSRADLSPMTIRAALVHAFNPAHDVAPRVAQLVLAKASSPRGMRFFADGWDSTLAVVLLVLAVKHHCCLFLDLLLQYVAHDQSLQEPCACHSCENRRYGYKSPSDDLRRALLNSQRLHELEFSRQLMDATWAEGLY